MMTVMMMMMVMNESEWLNVPPQQMHYLYSIQA